jgi:hypothetical protein
VALVYASTTIKVHIGSSAVLSIGSLLDGLRSHITAEELLRIFHLELFVFFSNSAGRPLLTFFLIK